MFRISFKRIISIFFIALFSSLVLQFIPVGRGGFSQNCVERYFGVICIQEYAFNTDTYGFSNRIAISGSRFIGIFFIGCIMEIQKVNNLKLKYHAKDFKTGFNDLAYPIIGFGGNWAEPMGVNSYEEYKNEYLLAEGCLKATEIIDSDLVRYKIVKKKSKINVDKEFEYEDVEESGNIEIDKLVTDILEGVKEIRSSCYDGLEDEIANSQSVPELVNVLNKGAF